MEVWVKEPVVRQKPSRERDESGARSNSVRQKSKWQRYLHLTAPHEFRTYYGSNQKRGPDKFRRDAGIKRFHHW